MLTASHTEASISSNEFLGNDASYARRLLNFDGVLTSIDHSKFINNTGSILRASHTEVSISYNEFLGNDAYGWCLLKFDGVLTSIDHSKFINNTGYSVLCVANIDMITLHLNEFINNNSSYYSREFDGYIFFYYGYGSSAHMAPYYSREFDRQRIYKQCSI